MKTFFVGLFLVTALAPAACATTKTWTRANFTEAQLAKDKYQCMRETGFTDPSTSQRMGVVMGAASMQGPFNPYAAQAHAIGQSENLFNACMAASGYKLEEKQQGE